jgi:hypothetical protein
MMWFLMCVIAGAIGLILYSSIEDKVPEILRLPKSSSSSSAHVAPGAKNTNQGGTGFAPVASSSRMWQVRGDGANVELLRDFRGMVEHEGNRYDAPTLLLTCYQGEVFAGVDLHMAPATKGEKAPVRALGTAQSWTVGEGHRIYSPAPQALLAAVRAERKFDMVLPYAEIGNKTVTFDPADGAKALAYFPPACR